MVHFGKCSNLDDYINIIFAKMYNYSAKILFYLSNASVTTTKMLLPY